MKSFFFLLFTISLLVMIQIQSGMLQNSSSGYPTLTKTPSPITVSPPPMATTGKSAMATTRKSAMATTRKIAVATSKKKGKSAAPALSSLGSGSILVFLTNILIQLFHLR